jgi:hypothetical protein
VNFRIVSLLTLTIVFLFSCKKQDNNVFLTNEGTLGFDGYSYNDSLTLLTKTVREDSIKTDSLSHNLIGIINDQTFGKYEAISFFQFKIPQLDKVISTETLDSAVLFIQFTSKTAYYGDLNSSTSFKVYELSEAMNSSVSHSNQSYTYNPTEVGSFVGKFQLEDSVPIMELGKPIKMAPGISIKLSSALASKLFNASSANLSSQENFLQFFNGLAIVPDANPSSGSGVIAALNMRGTFSKLRIYYNDSLQSDLAVIDGARRHTQYIINNQSAAITNQKSSAKTANFDSTFIQSMVGAKTHIQIPYLFSTITSSSKKISIGKAELIIRPIAGTFSSPFDLPDRLLLLQPNPDNNLNAGIIDLLEPFYGGDYDATNNEYRFNTTRHIQSLYTDYQLNGIDNNRGLFLLAPSDFPIAPSRMFVDTRKGIPNQGIEFKLIYTEL